MLLLILFDFQCPISIIMNLQYTLLLLIPRSDKICKRIKNLFTIHFATINTKEDGYNKEENIHLQYTLLLLIPWTETLYNWKQQNLQYTLLLLIRMTLQVNLHLRQYLQYTLLLLIQWYRAKNDKKLWIYNTLCYY